MAADAKAIITEAASRYGVSPAILYGLYGTESAFGKDTSTSSAGAVGPFQFEPKTAAAMGVNPYNFKSAAFGAAKFLSEYKGRGVAGMLSAYNAGPAGGEQPAYVKSVLANAKGYGGAGSLAIPAETSAVSSSAAGGSTAGSGGGRTFDAAAFQKAQRAAIVGKLFAENGEQANNPLFATGLVSAKAPTRAEFETSATAPDSTGQTTTTGVPVSGAPLVLPNPAKSPVKTNLPKAEAKYGEVAFGSKDYPQGNVGEVSPALRALAEAKPVIARAPTGVVVKHPSGQTVFIPHKESRNV